MVGRKDWGCTQERLDEFEAHARALSPSERDRLVAQLIEAGAPGDVFERLHRAGWRPVSYSEGDSIVGGALEEVAPRLRRRRK